MAPALWLITGKAEPYPERLSGMYLDNNVRHVPACSTTLRVCGRPLYRATRGPPLRRGGTRLPAPVESIASSRWEQLPDGGAKKVGGNRFGQDRSLGHQLLNPTQIGFVRIGGDEDHCDLAIFADAPNCLEAVRAVARFGPHAAVAVRPLLDLFKHEDPAIRWQAVRATGKIGPPAVPAVPALIQLLGSDPDPLVREHAAEALGDIGPPAADGIPALVQALRDPVARVRRDAAWALGQMGPAAKEVLTEVRAAADDPDPDVKAAAIRAARLIDPATSSR